MLSSELLRPGSPIPSATPSRKANGLVNIRKIGTSTTIGGSMRVLRMKKSRSLSPRMRKREKA